MNPEQLKSTAIRRVVQAAGVAHERWLAIHRLTGETTSAPDPQYSDSEVQLLTLCRNVAAHGRLLEAGLAAGRDSAWLLHPARGLRMSDMLAVASLLTAGDLTLNWNTLRDKIAADHLTHDVALTLNLLCKTLDIPLGALALDRLELYAWKPQAGGWLLRRLARKRTAAGWVETRLSGRRAR